MTINRSRTFYFHQSNMSDVKRKGANGGTSALEQQVDELFYTLYGLTPEEIAIVEGKNKTIKGSDD